jgi:manganese transport protein
VDPGNFESDLQAGVLYGYSLLWVLLWATLAGLFVQAMCVRLALATGWHLARVMRDEYPPRVRYALWVATELAIVASDIPEVIGTALALKLIFGLPTAWGVGVTSLSTLLFLGLQSFGVRKLEAFIGALVGVMSICFVAQMSLLGGGDGGEVMVGIVAPVIKDLNALFIAISLLGAVVMPHNLFLHSALVLSRTFSLGERALKSAYKYNVAECGLALLVTLIINFAVVIVAARSIRDADFHDPTGERRQGIIDRPLQNAPEMLKDVLGVAAKGMFAAALLASGQSSTITGTYAGQFVMEGFLELRINPVLRAFLTRSAAIVPSLLVILIAGDEYAEFLIVVSSVILFVQLPYALIPLVKFCGDQNIVGPMALDSKTRRVMRLLCALVVVANVILLIQMLHESRLVNATAGGVFLGFFVTFLAIAYVGSIAWLAARPVSQNLATRVERRMRGETHGTRLDETDDEGRDEVGFGGGDDDAREMRGVASFRVDTPPLPPGAGASRV